MKRIIEPEDDDKLHVMYDVELPRLWYLTTFLGSPFVCLTTRTLLYQVEP